MEEIKCPKCGVLESGEMGHSKPGEKGQRIVG